MHDIKFIRENPEAFDAGLRRRGINNPAQHIIHEDINVRGTQTRQQEYLAKRKDVSKAIGSAKSAGNHADAEALLNQVEDLKSLIANSEIAEAGARRRLNDILESLPNIPADDVPEGKDENDNVVIKTWGTPRTDNTTKEHFDIGPALGLDFESAQAVSGARFAYLRKGVARLSRALGQFMLDLHTTQHGYEEVNPPLLVREHAMFGTAQLPKFAEDSFKTNDDRWLISTSEISLTNLVREQILKEAELPLRFTALTPCFRSEAGAAGKDTRGLIRQHQFEKVEMVAITRPEDSDAEHERMTLNAEAVLEALELPYRRMLLCTGDMGFSARKTFDLEVWLPGQGKYREISSVSNCGDFQARRMGARFRRSGEKAKPEFVHTLNGSGVAVGRALVAVLENYQNADGSVTVPKALLPYMGGVTVLTP